MTPILLDTNAYVEFLRGAADAIAILNATPGVFLNSIIHGELLAGIKLSDRAQRGRAELDTFMKSGQVTVLPIDEATAEIYADIYRALRNAGTPIPTNDMWIAASALQHDLSVYSYDAHFRRIPDLICGKTLAELSV